MSWFAVAKKKEKWVATWFGNLLKITFILLLVIIYVLRIHPFLAQQKPVQARLMVVEGFIPDYALEKSMDIFLKGNYELMIITGKKRLKGSQLDQYDNDGIYSAETLIKLGFDKNKIQVVALENDIKKDRTYASALAVKKWIKESGLDDNKLDLVSISCHARRSRILFDKAFGNETDIGIIAIPTISYDHKNGINRVAGSERSLKKPSPGYMPVSFFPEN
ncbi:MAG: hypothetical protein R2764_16950 [Bacteroidales bacterium]